MTTATVVSQVTEKHPVDQIPPLARLAPLGLQHVLAMYAGAVAVPLIVGCALVSQGELLPSDLPYLISADLLIIGLSLMPVAAGWAGGGVASEEFGAPSIWPSRSAPWW